jgi:hypothetical protein
MSTLSKRDAVESAMSIAADVTAGTLDPANLESEVIAAARDLVGTVVGEGDPLWPLQLQIARGVLAAGGLSGDEVSEWLSVARHRARMAQIDAGGAIGVESG